MKKVHRFARLKNRSLIYGNLRNYVTCEKVIPSGELVHFLREPEKTKVQLLGQLEDSLASSDLMWPPSSELTTPLGEFVRDVLCLGKNFVDHAKETSVGGLDTDHPVVPIDPVVFSKNPFSFTDPVSEISMATGVTEQLDYEGEVVIVIGRDGKDVPPENAWDYVFGYTLLNDVTARDLQKRHRQYYIGKNLEGVSALGPWVTFKESVDKFEDLTINTWVNDELRQEGSLRDLIFNVPSVLSILSKNMMIRAGDLISLGTPAGVGMGFEPPRFLKKGDVVRILAHPLGELHSTVV